jgi:phage tail sheath protein FI
MASRTIASPGVQITEQDLSIITRPIGVTDVLITGFAPQGPTEDLVNVSDITEFEQIYGTPTNAAERYLYHSAKQLLNTSPANLLVSRLPYGSEMGEGYTNKYSALVYFVSANKEEITNTTIYALDEIVTVNGLNQTELLDNLVSLGTPYSLYATTTAAVDTNTYKSTNPRIDTTIQTPVYATLTSVNLSDISTEAVIQQTRDLSSLYVPVYPYLRQLFELYSSDVNVVNTNQWSASLLGTGNTRTVTIRTSSLNTVITNYTISVSTFDAVTTSVTNYVSTSKLSEATNYVIQEPISILLSQDQRDKLISNEINWLDEIVNGSEPISFSSVNHASIIVLNESKTSINDLYEGYYVGLVDNSNINPSTDYDSISAINTTQSLSSAGGVGVQILTKIPESRLNFKLTEPYTGFSGNSISESLENSPTGFDFSSKSFNDSIVLGLYKIKTSIYNQDTVTLDYRLVESYVGSLYSKRTQNNPNFGTANTFFLESVVDGKSDNIKVIINPYISNSGIWTNSDGSPAKSVRISNSAKALYPSGVYTPQRNQETNDLGNVPLKLQRVLNQIQNNDTINIDVVAECGLGTIWVGAKSKKENSAAYEYVFDDTYTVDITDLKDSSGQVVTGVNSDYASIANKFVSFVSDRKDHVFIADPLRYIFVQGKNFKAQAKKSSYVFSNDVYWPLKNQFASYQSSYMATYGNWLRVNDDIMDQLVWVPSSGFAAAIYASTSQIAFPWAAPAGFNRGTIYNVTDLGITPNQKQTDLLYKINVNPINFFGTDGFAIFGQKTLYRKPSAFDRINVRRLFLTLEKETKQLLKYYVFEPNTFTTRQRLIGSLQPTFDKAKVNDGLYEYQIICDERNNTPDVIDNNELRISIYIKPVRTAEFILADFIGTRTGVSFSELIG